MRNLRQLWRAARRAAAQVTVALLVAAAAFVLPQTAAAQPPPAQGVQFGDPVDLNVLDPATGTCKRHSPVNRLLYNAALLSRTSWIRINLRAAGGMYPGNPSAQIACPATLWSAYRAILDDFASRAPWVQVIGLLTHDFWYGSYDADGGYDTEGFARLAGDVACSPAYQQVDVWQVWNEPDIDSSTSAYLPPVAYAKLAGLTSRAIRDCGTGDKVISAGLVPPASSVIEYLRQVDADWNYSWGRYNNLAQAVDGVGLHPYVSAIDLGDNGHGHLNSFLGLIAAAVDRPLYVTEFGWPIVPGLAEERQCHNLVNAFRVVDGWAAGAGDDRVVAAIWFALQDFPQRTFGLYDVNSQGRLALTGYITGVCGQTPAPSLVTATALSPGSVRVTWRDNSINETGFVIHNGNGWSASVGPDVTSYTRTGLAPGTLQCLYVGALDNGGRVSMASTYSCATTPSAPAPPDAPLGVTAMALDSSRIQISWIDNSAGETGFAIANGTTAVNVGANITTYVWGFLAPGTSMCFWVAAKNSNGQSPWSNQACATTL